MTGTIEKRILNDISTWMKPIQETNLPAILKGVFFMDGNPLPDTCITMYNLEWDSQNLSLSLPVYGPLQWTFHDSIFGWLLLLAAQISQFTYKIQFEDATLQSAQIISFSFGLPIPKWIADFSMCQTEDSRNGDTWKRKNVWLAAVVLIVIEVISVPMGTLCATTQPENKLINKTKDKPNVIQIATLVFRR
ncbi:MAG: hypothetical protein DSM106950_09470 [Stigonema ocellatum SAG 48.90 = DSM 106950]|nr:hypothetical protein [Stigonema ocellatum SAG 48.90 = DSM 106950]